MHLRKYFAINLTRRWSASSAKSCKPCRRGPPHVWHTSPKRILWQKLHHFLPFFLAAAFLGASATAAWTGLLFFGMGSLLPSAPVLQRVKPVFPQTCLSGWSAMYVPTGAWGLSIFKRLILPDSSTW